MGYFTPRWVAVYGYFLIVLIATPYLPLLIQWASSSWPAASISGFVLGVEISIGILLIVLAGAIFFFNIRKFPYFLLIISALIAFASLFYLIIPNPYELTHLPEYAILGILTLHAIKGGEGKKEKVNEACFAPVRMSPSENTGRLCKILSAPPANALSSPGIRLRQGRPARLACARAMAGRWRTGVAMAGRFFTRGIMALVKSNRVYLRSGVITGSFGTIDELYQGILPLRYFAWHDILLNGLGGLLGLTIFWGVSRE